MFTELTALDKAIDFSIHQKYENILILTDSKTTCFIRTVIKFVKITWVPSHIRIQANKKVERAANDVRTEGFELKTALTHETMKPITDECQRNYQESSQSKCTHFYEIFQKVVSITE